MDDSELSVTLVRMEYSINAIHETLEKHIADEVNVINEIRESIDRRTAFEHEIRGGSKLFMYICAIAGLIFGFLSIPRFTN